MTDSLNSFYNVYVALGVHYSHSSSA